MNNSTDSDQKPAPPLYDDPCDEVTDFTFLKKKVT